MKLYELALRAKAMPVPDTSNDSMIQWHGECPGHDGADCGGTLIIWQDSEDQFGLECSKDGESNGLWAQFDVEFPDREMSVTPFDLEKKTHRRQMDNYARREAGVRDNQLDAVVTADKIEWLPLTSLLAEDLPETPFRVEGLWPIGGNVVLAAQAKAGKSTLSLNLIRSLVTGEKFLGQFNVVKPKGRIALLDLELSRRNLQAWFRAAGIDSDQVVVLPMRGRASAVGAQLLDDTSRAAFAEQFKKHDVEILIVDPLSVLANGRGIDESNNTEMGRLLRGGLAGLQADAGISELFVIHHAGHTGDRSRGASVIMDWPDANWFLKTDSEEADMDTDNVMLDRRLRYLRANGRDVDMPESALTFDPVTKKLSIKKVGESRTRRRANVKLLNAEDAVITALRDVPDELVWREVRETANTHYAAPNQLYAQARDNLLKEGKILVRTEGRTMHLSLNQAEYLADTELGDRLDAMRHSPGWVDF